MKDLLIFTIGPVQSLINHSRKISDMYAGSKLLSGLMRESVCFLSEKPGVHILFPVEGSEETAGQFRGRSAGGQEGAENEGGRGRTAVQESDMPNRLIAEIFCDDAAYTAGIGRELEAWVRRLFLEKSRELLHRAGIGREGLEMAERQLRDYLEVYWSAEPYGNRPYKAVYRSLFRRIQEVKGIRPFEQTAEPWNRKCMLFPEYNAVFVKKKEREKYPSNVNSADICDITDIAALRYLVKSGEALSAIALVKRVYPNPEEIYSLRQMLLRSRVNQLPRKGPGEGDMLANAVYDIENENPPDYEEYDEEMWEEAGKLCGRIHRERIRLSSYYAMVKLDGDSMGEKFLSLTSPQKQRELSLGIGRFARQIPDILDNHGGLLVYAGGEDFLGFLPLDTLFSCLEELRRAFRSEVGLTFSAGVVIAHLMQPLKEVAAAAEEMEHLAKQAAGKNACVAGLLKRGGEAVVTPPLCFDQAPGRIWLQEWRQLIGELDNSGVSKSLLYHLGDLFRRFLEEDAGPEKEMAWVLVHEAAVSSGAPDPDRITQRLMAFYENDGGLEGFMSILNASAFLAREVKACTT